VKTFQTIAIVAALGAAHAAAAQDLLFQTPGQAGAPDVLFQTAVPPPPPGTPGDVIVFGPAQAAPAIGATFERRMDILGVEPLDLADTVTGAPYTADIVTETVQTLADGNRIERQTRSSVARDAEGRVRREQPIAAIGPIVPQQDLKIVMIVDPVANVHYSLDEKNRIATRMPSPTRTRMEAGVRLQMPPGGAPLGAAASGGVATGMGVAAGTAMMFVNTTPQDERTEPLGRMQIEGVDVDGTRTTVTIPAGAIGNQAPIEIVSERWYSPELKAVVSSRRFDPRFGETTYRMENIVRAEPSPELFKVPADYTVRTTMGMTMKP
jgi:hypothetical protein